MSDASKQPDLLERELKGLKDLLSVAQVVVSSLDLDEVLQNILHSAMTIMDMPAGTIALYDEGGGKLELHAHAGLSETFTAHDRWTVKPGGLTHEILERGELFVVEDTEQAGFFNNPLAIAEGIRSLIAVPLKMQRKTVGVLYVDDFVPRHFPQERLELLSVLGSFATMSIDNARLHRKTLELACTDGLTGLYNQRQFKKVFTEEVARAARYGKPLSIILLDVDDFKKFNDTYGHPNGDIVLQQMARMLIELLRGSDLVFRYGGEEFVILLPETAFPATLRVAERIRIFVETETPKFLDRITSSRGVTVSVGVASFPEDGDSVAMLFKTVDDLMYEAKRKGKNRVYYREREGQCPPSES
ncbi:MAG: sensor domain-containing diguanylate cyclase [Deltaproteobacteria bacterium]|nr:MAG: sensor domain-containing diguanylate cyclase [Deltaproteobacteria bacterium]